MRDHFNQNIEDLNQRILQMGVLVVENIRKASKALLDQNSSLAQEVILADEQVDALEMSISDECAIIIAREQPVARDLRHIVACLKVVSDVERIGDYAVHAAKRARDLADESYIKPLIDLPQMLILGSQMLEWSLDALTRGDESLARETAKKDAQMDSLNKQIYRELLTFMMEDPQNIKQATKLLHLSRLLERMGDHAVNICSWAIYILHGKHEDL